MNQSFVNCAGCGMPQPSTSKFCGQCGNRLAPPEPRFSSLASYRSSRLSSLKAVRCQGRRATVLFSDVAGFTEMSSRLDPEHVFAIMERVFGVMLDAVHRHDGTVNQFLGDGVMALFETADQPEDHARRALAASLAIQEDLESLRAEIRRTHGIEFRVRTGIHTGRIVIGAIGANLRADYTALGPTVHVAASLLRVAQPGQIVLTDETRRIASSSLVFDSLGEVAIDGTGSRVPVFAIVPEFSPSRHGLDDGEYEG